MNDKRFDKRLSLKKHGSNEADDENEERGEKSWQVWVTINQSISEGPIYSNFTPECSASLPQHRHRQSINQTGGRGRIYNLVYKAYSAFLHTVQIGGFSACQPTSLGILRCNRADWRLWRKFGRANKIWPQTHHFGSPFAIIQLLTKVLHRRVFWYHWLLRIYGFVFLCGIMWKKIWKQQETALHLGIVGVLEKNLLCSEPSDKLGGVLTFMVSQKHDLNLEKLQYWGLRPQQRNQRWNDQWPWECWQIHFEWKYHYEFCICNLIASLDHCLIATPGL